MRVKDDSNELTLCDSIITIIYEKGGNCVEDREVPEFGVGVIYHSGEYDDPITLKSIHEKYGKVHLVISESPLSGKVYRYGNHGEFWEEIGQTEGYA